jgi:triosephosphate isomerase (TIM)
MSKIIVANWKMNGTKLFIQDFFKVWKAPSNQNKIIFCPPFPYISLVQQFYPLVGAQDCHEQDQGAFTGNVSAAMLKDLGCLYVILGHSERRQYHQESNQLIKKKAENALKNGVIPIVCVGESLECRQSQQAIPMVLAQLAESLPLTEEILIAYEPIWAIGTGLTATAHEIAEMHQAIAAVYPNVSILYGGSVTADNAAEIMSIPHVDGVLVGGASLKPEALRAVSS